MHLSPGLLALIIITSLMINTGMVAYFQYKKLETLEELLHEVSTISWNKSVWGNGFIGRQMRLNFIQLIVLTPGAFYKRGQIPKDVDKKIPQVTRRQLNVLFLFQCLNMTALFAFCVYVRY